MTGSGVGGVVVGGVDVLDRFPPIGRCSVVSTGAAGREVQIRSSMDLKVTLFTAV